MAGWFGEALDAVSNSGGSSARTSASGAADEAASRAGAGRISASGTAAEEVAVAGGAASGALTQHQRSPSRSTLPDHESGPRAAVDVDSLNYVAGSQPQPEGGAERRLRAGSEAEEPGGIMDCWGGILDGIKVPSGSPPSTAALGSSFQKPMHEPSSSLGSAAAAAAAVVVMEAEGAQRSPGTGPGDGSACTACAVGTSGELPPAPKLYLPGRLLWLIEDDGVAVEDATRQDSGSQRRVNDGGSGGSRADAATSSTAPAVGCDPADAGLPTTVKGDVYAASAPAAARVIRGRADLGVGAEADTSLVFAGDFGPGFVSLGAQQERSSNGSSQETGDGEEEEFVGNHRISGDPSASIPSRQSARASQVAALAAADPLPAAAPRRRICLVDAERSAFELLALVPSCATDHMPDTYHSVLLALEAGMEAL